MEPTPRRCLTQLWCKIPPRFPDDRSSDSWHSMQTKTTAFLFFLVFFSYVDMGFWNDERSWACLLGMLFFCFFLCSARARRDDTTTCLRAFFVSFFLLLFLVRITCPQELFVSFACCCWNTSLCACGLFLLSLLCSFRAHCFIYLP